MPHNRIAHLHWFWRGKSRHFLNSRNLQLQQKLLHLSCIEYRNTIHQSSHRTNSWSLISCSSIAVPYFWSLRASLLNRILRRALILAYKRATWTKVSSWAWQGPPGNLNANVRHNMLQSACLRTPHNTLLYYCYITEKVLHNTLK